jgi:hypothetical protein
MINLPQETVEPAKFLAAPQNVSIADAIKLALEEKARAAGVATGLLALGRQTLADRA